LQSLAPRDLLGFFPFLDNAGDNLDQPGFHAGDQGADPELLDQDDRVRRRVIGQDPHRMAALEELAVERPAPAAGEEPVAQAVAVDAEMAAVTLGLLQDLDVFVHGGDSRAGDLRVNRLFARRRHISPESSGWRADAAPGPVPVAFALVMFHKSVLIA